MKALQTGPTEYDARLRRAGHLSSQYSFATEFLDFYKHVAAIQKTLFAGFSEDGATGHSASHLRAPLDLTVLLPNFRGFLSAIERHSPPALASAAHQLSLLPSDSWIASLEAYWEHAGKSDQQIGAFAQFLSRAFLQPYAEFRASLLPKPPAVTAVSLCPLCNSRPLLAVLRPEGDGGKRFLLCSFCAYEWEFRRIFCPTCGQEAEDKLPIFLAEELPHLRVEACDTCKFYLLGVDLTKDGHAIPLVDDIAAIPMSLWAAEHGYSRLQPNLLGT